MSDKEMTSRQKLTHNEAIKLRATAYNNGAVSLFTVGIVSPVTGILTGSIEVNKDTILKDIFILGVMILYAIAAIQLRSIATQFLEGLEP